MKKNGSKNDTLYDQMDAESIGIIRSIMDPDKKFQANQLLRKLECSAKKLEDKDKLFSKYILNPLLLIREYKDYLLSKGLAISTVKDYISEAKKLIAYLTKHDYTVLDLSDKNIIEKYLAKRRKRVIKKKGEEEIRISSFSKIINMLNVFLKYLVERKIMDANFEKFKAPSKVSTIVDVITEEDLEKIIRHIKEKKQRFKNENIRDLLAINLFAKCGLRRQELINLNWEDINLEEKKIKIINSKGGRSRIVSIGDSLKEILNNYRKKRVPPASVRGMKSKKC